MAEVTVEGTLWIDLVDVWAWGEAQGIDTECAKTLRFDKGQNALLLELEDGTEKGIEAETFWAWVIDQQLPASLRSYETIFGTPRVDGPDLVIDFAAGSGSDPLGWARSPICLASWENQQRAPEPINEGIES